MNKPAPWWLAILLSFAFSVISGVIVLGFTRSANGYDKVKADIEKCAPYEYVDKQDLKLEKQIDKKADKEVVEMMKDDIKDIKENTRLILNMQRNNK